MNLNKEIAAVERIVTKNLDQLRATSVPRPPPPLPLPPRSCGGRRMPFRPARRSR
jgi:hypothetical protein